MRANVTTEFLAANSELQLNATLADSADAAQSDVQPRLLRPLLLGLAAEFNDTGVREQAVALFSVGFCRPECPFCFSWKGVELCSTKDPHRRGGFRDLLEVASKGGEEPDSPKTALFYPASPSVKIGSRTWLRVGLRIVQDINSPAWKQDVDIRGNVYRIVASSGRREDYEAIKNLYLMACLISGASALQCF